MQNETVSLHSARHKVEAHRSSGGTKYRHLLAPVLALSLLAQACAATTQVEAPSSAPNSTSASAPAASVVLAIFSDRPMSNEFWPTMVTALREELASGAPETRFLPRQTPGAGQSADPTVQILRGDRIVPSLNVNNSITIHLHGDCVIHPPGLYALVQPSISGVLGWVRRNHGYIEPFIHVECTPLAQMLAAQTYRLHRDQQNRLMAVAIARVILHEWIHIATQNPGHARGGLAKAAFSPQDLVGNTVNRPADHHGAQKSLEPRAAGR
jgi:hypothetical protein